MAKKISEQDIQDMVDEEEFDLLLDEQPLKPAERKLLDTIYERLETFEQRNQFYHEEAKKCRKILHMEDPDQDTADVIEQNGKKTLQLQTLKSTFNNVVADQMLSAPEAKLLPETASMQEAADDLQDMVHYVVYVANNFDQVQHKRCEDFYGPGTAITQIAWDQDMNYGRGEIAIVRWPIEAFLWDPMAEFVQDCRAVMKVSWHPLSWFTEHWPDEGRYVSGESHTHNDVGVTQGQEDADDANDEERAMLIEYWWREYDAKKRRYTINVAYAAGNALLDVDKNVYDHGMYPFVVEQHDRIEGSLAGDGLVRELAPMMRYINRYAAYMDANARRASKGRAFIRNGSGIDKDAIADWSQDVVECDQIGPDAFQWIQDKPFNNVIRDLMLQMQTDLKQDSGANQFTRGETTGGIVSGKAINSLIQAGGKVASMRTEQLKYGFKQIVEQIIWLMAQFYDNDRVFMITGRKDAVKVDTEKLFGKKTKGAVNPPPYTVQIEVSSRDPQRIANQNQMFMEAYTMSAQAQQFFPLSALFQILNLDGKDKILPEIKKNEHYQEQMLAMQQQLEQASQQMEQLQSENVNLKKANTQMGNAIASMGARSGEQPPEDQSAIVSQAENNFGQQTGQPLPV